VKCVNRYCSCYTGCDINWHGVRIGQEDDGTLNPLPSTKQSTLLGLSFQHIVCNTHDKYKSKVVTPDAMKIYGRMEVWPHSFLTWALEGGDWSASSPGRFFPGK
jgi:hypothetical protein